MPMKNTEQINYPKIVVMKSLFITQKREQMPQNIISNISMECRDVVGMGLMGLAKPINFQKRGSRNHPY